MLYSLLSAPAALAEPIRKPLVEFLVKRLVGAWLETDLDSQQVSFSGGVFTLRNLQLDRELLNSMLNDDFIVREAKINTVRVPLNDLAKIWEKGLCLLVEGVFIACEPKSLTQDTAQNVVEMLDEPMIREKIDKLSASFMSESGALADEFIDKEGQAEQARSTDSFDIGQGPEEQSEGQPEKPASSSDSPPGSAGLGADSYGRDALASVIENVLGKTTFDFREINLRVGRREWAEAERDGSGAPAEGFGLHLQIKEVVSRDHKRVNEAWDAMAAPSRSAVDDDAFYAVYDEEASGKGSSERLSPGDKDWDDRESDLSASGMDEREHDTDRFYDPMPTGSEHGTSSSSKKKQSPDDHKSPRSPRMRKESTPSRTNDDEDVHDPQDTGDSPPALSGSYIFRVEGIKLFFEVFSKTGTKSWLIATDLGADGNHLVVEIPPGEPMSIDVDMACIWAYFSPQQMFAIIDALGLSRKLNDAYRAMRGEPLLSEQEQTATSNPYSKHMMDSFVGTKSYPNGPAPASGDSSPTTGVGTRFGFSIGAIMLNMIIDGPASHNAGRSAREVESNIRMILREQTARWSDSKFTVQVLQKAGAEANAQNVLLWIMTDLKFSDQPTTQDRSETRTRLTVGDMSLCELNYYAPCLSDTHECTKISNDDEPIVSHIVHRLDPDACGKGFEGIRERDAILRIVNTHDARNGKKINSECEIAPLKITIDPSLLTRTHLPKGLMAMFFGGSETGMPGDRPAGLVADDIVISRFMAETIDLEILAWPSGNICEHCIRQDTSQHTSLNLHSEYVDLRLEANGTTKEWEKIVGRAASISLEVEEYLQLQRGEKRGSHAYQLLRGLDGPIKMSLTLDADATAEGLTTVYEPMRPENVPTGFYLPAEGKNRQQLIQRMRAESTLWIDLEANGIGCHMCDKRAKLLGDFLGDLRTAHEKGWLHVTTTGSSKRVAPMEKDPGTPELVEASVYAGESGLIESMLFFDATDDFEAEVTSVRQDIMGKSLLASKGPESPLANPKEQTTDHDLRADGRSSWGWRLRVKHCETFFSRGQGTQSVFGNDYRLSFYTLSMTHAVSASLMQSISTMQCMEALASEGTFQVIRCVERGTVNSPLLDFAYLSDLENDDDLANIDLSQSIATRSKSKYYLALRNVVTRQRITSKSDNPHWSTVISTILSPILQALNPPITDEDLTNEKHEGSSKPLDASDAMSHVSSTKAKQGSIVYFAIQHSVIELVPESIPIWGAIRVDGGLYFGFGTEPVLKYRAHADQCHLLVSDWDMPDMHKVIITTAGYTPDMASPPGVGSLPNDWTPWYGTKWLRQHGLVRNVTLLEGSLAQGENESWIKPVTLECSGCLDVYHASMTLLRYVGAGGDDYDPGSNVGKTDSMSPSESMASGVDQPAPDTTADLARELNEAMNLGLTMVDKSSSGSSKMAGSSGKSMADAPDLTAAASKGVAMDGAVQRVSDGPMLTAVQDDYFARKSEETEGGASRTGAETSQHQRGSTASAHTPRGFKEGANVMNFDDVNVIMVVFAGADFKPFSEVEEEMPPEPKKVEELDASIADSYMAEVDEDEDDATESQLYHSTVESHSPPPAPGKRDGEDGSFQQQHQGRDANRFILVRIGGVQGYYATGASSSAGVASSGGGGARSGAPSATVTDSIKVTLDHISVEDHVQDSQFSHLFNEWAVPSEPRDSSLPQVSILCELLRQQSTDTSSSSSDSPNTVDRRRPKGRVQDVRLSVTLQPFRIAIDQDTLLVLLDSWCLQHSVRMQTLEAQLAATLPATQYYFHYVSIAACRLRVDYLPKRVDYDALRNLSFGELINVMALENVNITLPKVKVIGVLGMAPLVDRMAEIYVPHVQNSELLNLIRGIGLVGRVLNMGTGIADLVLLPIQQYMKDGRFLWGLRRGADSFLRTTSGETLRLSAQVAGSTHGLLQRVHQLLVSAGLEEAIPEEQESAAMADSEERREYLLSESGVHARHQRMPMPAGSLTVALLKGNPAQFRDEPDTLQEGLRRALSSVQEGVSEAARIVVAVPVAGSSDDSSTSGYSAAVRAVPVALIRPALGISDAMQQVLQGLRNEFYPEYRAADGPGGVTGSTGKGTSGGGGRSGT